MKTSKTSDDVRRVVRRTQVAAVAVAVVLSPIPLADEIVFVPMLGVMALKIARAHRLPSSRIPYKAMARAALGGLAARVAINLPVAGIPGVAAVANAVSAAALVEVFSRYADKVCAAA